MSSAASLESRHVPSSSNVVHIHDTAVKVLVDTQSSVQPHEDSKALKVFDRSCEVLDMINSDAATVQSAVSLLKPAYESDTMTLVRQGVNMLIDSLPGLLRALDTVAKLHPFIGVAVGVFNFVIELNLKRLDNDKKRAALFLQMKDMMEALLQLEIIHDQDSIGAGGVTIKARMHNLIKLAADDITSCGNACDAYNKKHSISKVFQAHDWEKRFQSYIDRFAERRKAFLFALALHTGAAVDTMNRTVDELNSKMDAILVYFKEASDGDIKRNEFAVLVQEKGGPATVLGNTKLLRELLKSDQGGGIQQHIGDVENIGSQRLDDDSLSRVKNELLETPEVAMQKNLEVFDRKLRMQQRESEEEMRRMVHHEGDRVILAVTSGPHDRIIDPDIHEIWKDMRWPGHVKTRHFILALRDYFREQFELKKDIAGDPSSSRVPDDDEWALRWVDINRLPAIAEAFDDDASGFITIAEVNQFTNARPKGWSLLRWLAYWAIGWQMTTAYYIREINCILGKMFSLERVVHRGNARAVQLYLSKIYPCICLLTTSFVCTVQSDSLRDRFHSYVSAEEQRLREGLETVRYNIDAVDTVKLVMGPGRVEKSLFPVLYLLFKRDFEIFRLCHRVVLNRDELCDSTDTIEWVLDAVHQRCTHLSVLFKQRGSSDASQLRTYASELYNNWDDCENFVSLKNLRTLEFEEHECTKEDVDLERSCTWAADELLKYPLPADEVVLYNIAVEDSHFEGESKADEAVRPILGRWHGFAFQNGLPICPMLSFRFRVSPDHACYEATEVAADGTQYTVLGGYVLRCDDTVEYKFTWTYATGLPKAHFSGIIDGDVGRLSGSWGFDEDETPFQFLFFKDVPPEVVAARPSVFEFEENRVRALWKYALTAALNKARRSMFSWSYLKERREIRLEYLVLLERKDSRDMAPDDVARFHHLNSLVTCEDIRAFYMLHALRPAPTLERDLECDVCNRPMEAATRLVCLDCNGSGSGTLDVCDVPACREAIAVRDDLDKPHLPSHDFVKVRRGFHYIRETGKLLRMSDTGLERARKLLTGTAPTQTTATSSEKQSADRAGDANIMCSLPARTAGTSLLISSSCEMLAAPSCVSCSSAVHYPCWYCIDCPAESKVFVCWECDERNGGINIGEHMVTHSMVSCKEKVRRENDGSNLSVDQRLRVLEDKLGILADGDKVTKQRLEAMENKILGLAEQMARIETLLQSALAA